MERAGTLASTAASARRGHAIQQRQRVLDLGRHGAASRFETLADDHPEDEQHARHQGAAEEQEGHLAVVEADLDLGLSSGRRRAGPGVPSSPRECIAWHFFLASFAPLCGSVPSSAAAVRM
jgi:hypothetical protein